MGKTPKKKARERLAEREKGTREGERACNHFFSDPLPRGGGGGGTLIHYLYGYVPPKGVVILKLLI